MAHGNTGKANASKSDADKNNSQLNLRCKSSDKDRWVAAAKGEPLSAWIINCLNEAVAKTNDK